MKISSCGNSKSNLDGQWHKNAAPFTGGWRPESGLPHPEPSLDPPVNPEDAVYDGLEKEAYDAAQEAKQLMQSISRMIIRSVRRTGILTAGYLAKEILESQGYFEKAEAVLEQEINEVAHSDAFAENWAEKQQELKADPPRSPWDPRWEEEDDDLLT